MPTSYIRIDTETVDVNGVLYRRAKDPLLDKIEKWISYHQGTLCDIKMEEKNGEHFITFSLPLSNTQWTFEVFSYVKQVVKDFKGSFPVHGKGYDETHCLWVRIIR